MIAEWTRKERFLGTAKGSEGEKRKHANVANNVKQIVFQLKKPWVRFVTHVIYHQPSTYIVSICNTNGTIIDIGEYTRMACENNRV